ncbi:MAG: type IV pilus modification protein PilV [Wenzhouxiangellaceae bacterium]|nr:type IV pilus modification protein PilV [Wenzhouxiangellaceae bacterium]
MTRKFATPFRPLSAAISRRGQSGLSLIEILVTLLVLSIGLLGLAALQGFSLQAGQVSYYRTQATNIAYEVADFARANRSVATQGLLDALGDQLAADRLPSGTTDVAINGAVDEITVTVTWLDDREAGANASFEITTRI